MSQRLKSEFVNFDLGLKIVTSCSFLKEFLVSYYLTNVVYYFAVKINSLWTNYFNYYLSFNHDHRWPNISFYSLY